MPSNLLLLRLLRTSSRWAIALGLVIAIAAHLPDANIALAQNSMGAASEYDLKLARIYSTARFITWPDDSSSSVAPFVIGVVDPDPFKGGLKKLEKRKLKNRPIRIVMLNTEQDYQACHLLFIPSDAKPALVSEIMKRTADQPVLVWRDEVDPNGSTGVACSFVRQESDLLIEADPVELKRRNLAPDGQLLSLKLVRMVKPGK